MQDDPRNEFVDLEPYLIPATRVLLERIESERRKLGLPEEYVKVMLRKVYGSIYTWQVRNDFFNWHIDMPEWDEGNVVCFTHELLHIYFDFCLGIKVEHFGELLPMVEPYSQYFEDPWHLANQFITLTNHLQHHKMIPYFAEFQFPLDQIIGNYKNPEDVFQVFDNNLEFNYDFTQPVHRYMAALSYVNFLCLEYYFPNPEVRTKIVEDYSTRMDAKFEGMRNIFHPILARWDTEYADLRELIFSINSEAKTYAEAI